MKWAIAVTGVRGFVKVTLSVVRQVLDCSSSWPMPPPQLEKQEPAEAVAVTVAEPIPQCTLPPPETVPEPPPTRAVTRQ